jgi:aryl-alcohol dehydrogenase-like predicted oxidoreductase
MLEVVTPWSTTVSRIGFGCAGLGSRVGVRDGLRLLEAAIEGGITWIDVAPGYGDGRAETIIGRLPSSKKQRLHITTKVGLAAEPSWARRHLGPVARPLMARIPQLRTLVAGTAGVREMPLGAKDITANIEKSLSRLGVEQVGALLLHGPASARLEEDEAMRTTLLELRRAGKIAAFGVAPNDVPALTEKRAVDIVQQRATIFKPAANHAGFAVNHGTLSVLGQFRRVAAARPEIRALLPSRLDLPNAAALLTDYALATNACGVCLFSTMSLVHLEQLIRRASREPEPDAVRLGQRLATVFGGSRQ